VDAAIFVSIPEYILGVGRLRVVCSYVSCVFTVSDGYIPICLAYIRLITGSAWRNLWTTMDNTIEESLTHEMEMHYNNLNKKLDNLQTR